MTKHGITVTNQPNPSFARSLNVESEVDRNLLRSSSIFRLPLTVCIMTPCGRQCWWREYRPKSSTSCATTIRALGAECTLRVYGEFTDSFNVTTGIQQGCNLSSTIFNFIIDWIMNCAGASTFVITKNLSVQDQDYANNIALLADSVEAS